MSPVGKRMGRNTSTRINSDVEQPKLPQNRTFGVTA